MQALGLEEQASAGAPIEDRVLYQRRSDGQAAQTLLGVGKRFLLICNALERRFQLGFNRLYVFEKPRSAADPTTTRYSPG